MTVPQRVWAACGSRPKSYFAFSLLVITFAAIFVRHGRPLEIPLRQFSLGVGQILATHRIQSTFLPLGYSAFLGYIELLSRPLGRPDFAIFVAQVGVLYLIFVSSRSILQHFTSSRFATTVALLVTLDPVVLFNANRVTDADLTLALVLGFVATLFNVLTNPGFWNSCLAGITLGAAVLVRPNLLLLALLLLAMVRRPWLTAGASLLVACFAGLGFYVAFTLAIHGSFFVPQNGPYNFYAGFNPRTKEALLHEVNGEASIVPAMRDAGLHATLDWGRQSDVPGIDDVRDERYIPFYQSETRRFILQQPRKALSLEFLKLFTFLRPVHDVVDQSSTAFRIGRSATKMGASLPLLVWLLALIYGQATRSHLANPILLGAAVLYSLPFVLINADPRFRTTLEGIAYVDLARILYQWRQAEGLTVQKRAKSLQQTVA